MNLSYNNSFPLSKNGTNNASVSIQIIINIQNVPDNLAISFKFISSLGSPWCLFLSSSLLSYVLGVET